ncbi:A/G-specific adenine glycosylase [Alphaproteobacteria bacterium]|nr:A/G-specific adenine glycosylase [Alphaproteobacteria bacterium]
MKHSSIINNKILAYYKDNKRPLPWRTRLDNDQNPYYTLVSEVMLQQTQVNTVLGYYKKFIEKWPTIESLANADLEELLVMWSGLGYYNRAKNLLKTAKIILIDYNKVIPRDKVQLLKLPGIGEYTAAAIMSFAFGKHEFALDTNVKRFLGRVYDLNDSILSNKNELEKYSIKVFPKKNSGKFAQAVMDFSSAICTKVKPACNDCFLRKNCKYLGKSKKTQKVLSSKIIIKKFSIVQLYLYQKKYFFLTKRPLNKILGGLYEVPGSEWSIEGWPVIPKHLKKKPLLVDVIKHKFSHFELKTKIMVIHMKSKSLKKENGKWLTKKDLSKIPISTLTKKILAYSLK